MRGDKKLREKAVTYRCDSHREACRCLLERAVSGVHFRGIGTRLSGYSLSLSTSGSQQEDPRSLLN